jgi:DMSO/TMAO reductase YedYZ molybdopterin-dependent catalytic subunit
MPDMENRKIPLAVPIVLIAIAVAVVVILIATSSAPQINSLYPAEVRNFQGENLSSIAAVKPNAIEGIQNINRSMYNLTITGLVDKTIHISYDNVLSNYKNYQKVVTIFCVEGWRAKILWEGVLVEDLLKDAGANMSASVVIFRASDGYSTSLPLDYIINNKILLAYKMNNVTMPPERGWPFELVAESQFGYKWIKWVTQIEVSNNADYRGYWESRGYPNNATISIR